VIVVVEVVVEVVAEILSDSSKKIRIKTRSRKQEIQKKCGLLSQQWDSIVAAIAK
jgi:hypothetical protein